MDNLPIYVTGSVSVVTLVLSALNWSLARNVKHEDEAKRALATNQTALGEKLAKLEVDRASHAEVTALTSRVDKLATDQLQLTNDVKNLAGALSEFRSLLTEVRQALTAASDQQRTAWREEMGRLEQLLRQDLSRVATPELPERLADLSQRVKLLEVRLEGAGAPARRRRD